MGAGAGSEQDDDLGWLPARPGPARAFGVYLLFLALCLGVLGSALAGPFLSDDHLYLVGHPHTGSLTLANLAAVFAPFGDATVVTMNYAPVYLVLCALERSLFGDWTVGYHAVNAVVHGGNALLLVAMLRSSGLRPAGALVGGLLFLLHPAQVESVAWISQLKTLAAFGFGFGALHLVSRRPALASGLFALAVLTKFVTVALVLAAAAFVWVRPRREGERAPWPWLAGWLAFGIAVAVPQLEAFAYSGSAEVPPYADVGEQLRTMAAIGARYLAMAATGTGLSTWHEPAPASSWTDPWWLLALPLGAGLAIRMVVTLRRRSAEGAWWVCACAGFGPVSQLVPFYYPMGDHYLYFILPGLLGGSLLWIQTAVRGTVARGTPAPRAAVAAGLALAAFFGVRAAERAPLWTRPGAIDADAARHYPQGTTALYLEAVEAARRRDAAAAVAALRRAEARRPLALVRPILTDPRLSAIRDTPEFSAYLKERARERIALAERRGFDHPTWLRSTAMAHLVLEEYDEALALLRRARREGGPEADLFMEELVVKRARREAAGRDEARR